MIRVLIVDDDKLARKGLISIMPWSSYGMEVVGEAANGAKALEFLDQNPVDLMFVDIAMPVVSGIELIQEARKKYPDLRFVVLTCHEDFEYVQTTFRLGALDYISKVRLEMEDNSEILARIQEKLGNDLKRDGKILPYTSNKNEGRSAAPSCGINDKDKWHKIRNDWHALYWLYDGGVFLELCGQTVKANPPARDMEELFIGIVMQVKESTGINIDTWLDIKDLKSAIECIQRYRDLLYSYVSQSTDLQETPACILKAVLFIRNKIATPLHARAAASYVNMSRSYFCECFKRLVGLTFNDYIRKERMRIAGQLLCQSNHSIAWIAKAVGYSDVKYFSHIFYQQENLLPSEFRLQYHRGINDL